MERISIFDTTLRDGEQAAGGTLNTQEKLEIARQLEKLKVDVIEAGFPANSLQELEAVRLIAKEVRGPVICALSHANAEAIKKAWEAVKEAEHPRIHVFISASDIHLDNQLKKTREEVLETAKAMVSLAKSFTNDVEFSPMDASRADNLYLYQIVEAAISAGATVVNIPDTVGYSIPWELGSIIQGIFANVKNVRKTVISVHCHNDLGLAVANSLAAIENGARQVECTVNGIGERAGNASLEEIVMALKTRNDFLHYTTGIDTRQIFKSSRLVSELTGFVVQKNKAVVGDNAFSHASGIHQDGVLKYPGNYEIMKPEEVGVPASNIALGKLSGRHAFEARVSELGFSLTPEELDRAFGIFKEIAQQKKEVTDRDIEAIIRGAGVKSSDGYQLDHVMAIAGCPIPTAVVRIIAQDGKVLSDAASGTGPVDAAFKAIDHLVKKNHRLVEYTVKSISGGIDAIGEVLVRVESEGRVYTGRGVSTDIIVASVKAYINAINKYTERP